MDETKHTGLPVAGYMPQGYLAIDKVNRNKFAEEQVLRLLDNLAIDPEIDKRWLAIGRTAIEQGFMAVNRAVFKPERVKLWREYPSTPFRDKDIDPAGGVPGCGAGPADLNSQPGDRTPEGAKLGEELAKQEADFKREFESKPE